LTLEERRVQEFLQVDVSRDQRETDDGWLLYIIIENCDADLKNAVVVT